ncbi:hydroxyproline dehydrogenase-like [Saccoglossus kowalevskii]|uniref:Proline dehydrogenase n=1 Tax=Saccoglossus kowalevskii TaxID=10224 RepID=A0ABM0MEL1_SACKO|nr:PREDICTED: probable proline dehydrogenase 2-like [Saccoglossus kowalevskii]
MEYSQGRCVVPFLIRLWQGPIQTRGGWLTQSCRRHTDCQQRRNIHQDSKPLHTSATVGIHPNIQNSDSIIKHAANENVSAAPELNFSDTENSFKTKTTLEICRALAVLKMCSYSYFVDNSFKLMATSQNILGEYITSRLLKSTFYGQFVAGHDIPTIVKCVKRLELAGIASKLAIPLEKDLGGPSTSDEYRDKRCAENINAMEQCVDQTLHVCDKTKPLIMQVRFSALVQPEVLVKIGEPIVKSGYAYGDGGPLSIQNFAKGLNQVNDKIERVPGLTDSEFEHVNNTLHRLDRLAQNAVSNNTKILVDAEYTYLNPAMTLITLALMYKYNKTEPFIWNTYQNYLKAARTNINRDIGMAEKLGFTFGVKLVRGAYIDRERERSKQMGYEDPISPDYEATNKMYNQNLVMLLKLIKKHGKRYNMIIASHNEESINLAVNKINELGIDKTDGTVCFGQLLGMCDQVSYALGQKGYLAYKSLPVGTLDDVMPYLARRALENRSVLAGAKRERELLWGELKRRTLHF